MPFSSFKRWTPFQSRSPATDTNAKARILLIPGNSHRPSNFNILRTNLTQAGYKIDIVQYPSAAAAAADAISADVTTAKNALADLVKAGHDVVVVMHSYGGIPGSECIRGYSKAERVEKSLHGGVISLVYFCAFVPEAGMSVFEIFAGESKSAVQALHDELATRGENALAGMFHSTYEPWKEIPSIYVVCERDESIPKECQELFSSRAGGLWTVERFDTDHSPFLRLPEASARVIRRAAEVIELPKFDLPGYSEKDFCQIEPYY